MERRASSGGSRCCLPLAIWPGIGGAISAGLNHHPPLHLLAEDLGTLALPDNLPSTLLKFICRLTFRTENAA